MTFYQKMGSSRSKNLTADSKVLKARCSLVIAFFVQGLVAGEPIGRRHTRAKQGVLVP
jgi:hypothetical protein